MWPPPPPQQSPRSRLRGQLDQAKARDGLGHLARRVEDAVVAAEIAGVVKGHGGLERLGRPDPAAGDQLLDDLGVVDHLEGAPELRVLVADGVEAVRAMGDDLLEAVLLHGLDVGGRQGLVEILLARAAGPPRRGSAPRP